MLYYVVKDVFEKEYTVYLSVKVCKNRDVYLQKWKQVLFQRIETDHLWEEGFKNNLALLQTFSSQRKGKLLKINSDT